MFERFTESARRILFFARYEASQLGSLSIESDHLLLGLMREGKSVPAHVLDNHIGSEHLLLGLLREKGSLAAETLVGHGLVLEAARQQVAAYSHPPESSAAPDRAALLARVDHITDLVQRLQQSVPGDSEASTRIDLLLSDLHALKALLDGRQ